jgi:hypothetical protein
MQCIRKRVIFLGPGNGIQKKFILHFLGKGSRPFLSRLTGKVFETNAAPLFHTDRFKTGGSEWQSTLRICRFKAAMPGSFVYGTVIATLAGKGQQIIQLLLYAREGKVLRNH